MRIRFLFGLLLVPSLGLAQHPQTVWSLSELTALQNAATGTHSALATHLKAYLGANAGVIAPDNIGGYAMASRIMKINNANAVAQLVAHCNSTWRKTTTPGASDLDEASDISNGAIGYDVLYDLLTPAERATCRSNIGLTTTDFVANAACANGAPPCIKGPAGWWVVDLVNNHNWVDHAAIGLAGQALENEHPDAATWRAIANADFIKIKAVQDLVTDGSWHEGIGYMEFGLESMLTYSLGAVRRGQNFDKTALLSKVGRYVLYSQTPDHPRISVMTHGDWNWSRPGLIAILRWAARRYQDSFAQEAASRWDLEPRATTPWLKRQEFGRSFALEYVAYDPSVPGLAQFPPDSYNDDQQSFLMRTTAAYGSSPTGANAVVVGFKAGVYGGRGNHDRMQNCAFPGGELNFGHDHEDDLGLWIYGKGGWQLPEAVAYKLSTNTSTDFSSSRWHNTLIIAGNDQLVANKNATGAGVNCGAAPAIFWQREAQLPLHVSTDHFAFARADGQPCAPGATGCPSGRGLYPTAAGVQSLFRTVGLSRENGGFVTLEDRIILGSSQTIAQWFHSLNPGGTNSLAKPWLRLDNKTTAIDITPASNAVMGVYVLSPNPFTVTSPTLPADQYWRPVDDDGNFGHLTVAPGGAVSSATFLEVLWPTTATGWGSLPIIKPLDAAHPERGFTIGLGSSEETWIYNSTSPTTIAGAVTLQGSSRGDIGVRRINSGTGAVERAALLGSGKLLDQSGVRTLLDLAGNSGVLEIALNGTVAEVSGTANVSGVRFYGPTVTSVTQANSPLQWSKVGSMVTIGPGSGSGTSVIDQAQTSIVGPPLAIGGNSHQKLAQTVTIGQTGFLSEVQFPIACSNADLIISIEGVSAGGSPDGVSKSSRTFSGSTLPPFPPGAASFRPFPLSSPLAVTSGDKIAVVISSTGSTPSASCAVDAGPLADSYANGNAYFDAGPNAPGWVCICSFAGDHWDLPFKILLGMNTGIGTNVKVKPLDTATGAPSTSVDLTFTSVTQAGNTTVTPSAAGPAPPSGFQLGGLYYDVQTTATYTGTVRVCITDNSVTSSSKIFHYEGGAWVDKTVQPVVPPTICADVTSLSPFAVFNDVTPPRVLITTPASTTYTLGAVIIADYDCRDVGVGIKSCIGPVAKGAPVPTNRAGRTVFTVTAMDRAGNSTAGSVTYSIAYRVCAISPTSGRGVATSVQIRIRLCDIRGRTLTDVPDRFTVVGVDLGWPALRELSMKPGIGYFAPDRASSSYMYTTPRGRLTPGNHVLYFRVGDEPEIYRVPFVVSQDSP